MYKIRYLNLTERVGTSDYLFTSEHVIYEGICREIRHISSWRVKIDIVDPLQAFQRKVIK